MGLALTIRPQAVLMAPAMMMAVAGTSDRRRLAPIVEWAAMTAVVIALGFAPLAANGLMGDFLRSLRRASVGGTYNQIGLRSFVRYWPAQFLNFRYVATASGLLLLAHGDRGRTGASARTWLVAMAATSLYRPLSPNPAHAYLGHPLALVWCLGCASLLPLILNRTSAPASMRLAMVLLLVGLGVGGKPRFCNPNGSLEALTYLWKGVDPEAKPTGYATNEESQAAGRYEWDDYRRLIRYLRDEVGPEVRVANHLLNVPAVCGPSGRLPAFPAESSAWVRVVLASDEPIFARALETAEDAVVVWDPVPPGKPLIRYKAIDDAVRRFYEPAERFGPIEVWRRKR